MATGVGMAATLGRVGRHMLGLGPSRYILSPDARGLIRVYAWVLGAGAVVLQFAKFSFIPNFLDTFLCLAVPTAAVYMAFPRLSDKKQISGQGGIEEGDGINARDQKWSALLFAFEGLLLLLIELNAWHAIKHQYSLSDDLWMVFGLFSLSIGALYFLRNWRNEARSGSWKIWLNNIAILLVVLVLSGALLLRLLMAIYDPSLLRHS
ncbi:MAG TPA: hypothetical protein VFW40_03285 [Capsulimonadaceae bacterium]|nr:hypothetical protein [Capsulimonadaceae bacterium]